METSPAEQISTKYLELQAALHGQSVTVRDEGVLIKEHYHIGKRIDAGNRSTWA
jgi:hypothetical protein